jgi:hypothetical protein
MAVPVKETNDGDLEAGKAVNDSEEEEIVEIQNESTPLLSSTRA